MFFIVIKNCYGIGNNVWKFQVSKMKIVPVANYYPHNNDTAFVNGITSGNKLMNLREIGLFHIVWSVSHDKYHEICENVLGPKYINIYQFQHSRGRGGYMVHLTFFVYNSWKWKKHRSMTYTKIKFYIISIFKKIS